MVSRPKTGAKARRGLSQGPPPRIHTDGTCNSGASTAWKSYCLELAVIFTEWFPTWASACRYFRDLSECYEGYLNPVITTSYIEDLNVMWTQVHPALLEVTRWLEPFVDYGPDYNRATPLYDATIAVGCRARELFSREGAKEPDISRRADKVLQLLRKHRSKALTEMQTEMVSVMNTVSRDFDETDHGDNTPAESRLPSAEEVALVQHAVEVTGWQVTEPGSVRQRDALALHEVRVMKKYRPRLLRVGTVASQIRHEVVRILAQTEGSSVPSGEKVVFWDGIV
ncbi:hypothetical protein BJV78DRAFT_248827 [Lactifluus subvellereus]|nr:hypothetical protein BJV78DRAFT_248827 [Lactifluus subvellereus]